MSFQHSPSYHLYFKPNLFRPSKLVDYGLSWSTRVAFLSLHLHDGYLHSWPGVQHFRLWVSHHWIPSSPSENPSTWLSLGVKCVYLLSITCISRTIIMCSTPLVSTPLNAEETGNPHNTHILFLINHFSNMMLILQFNIFWKKNSHSIFIPFFFFFFAHCRFETHNTTSLKQQLFIFWSVSFKPFILKNINNSEIAEKINIFYLAFFTWFCTIVFLPAMYSRNILLIVLLLP